MFSLFEANPSLVDLLLDVLTTAPPLAEYLSRNAQVLDAVIGGDFFAEWPGQEALQSILSGTLSGLDDYEAQLDTARRFFKEWHFRAGVHHLRGLTSAEIAGQQYADLADAILGALWPCVVAEFSRRHGPSPGRGAAVIGMGSIGSARMTPASDLDVIVVYDPGDAMESEGPRPLAARTYYARLTQALITALSAQTSEGRLYEVDMRLRPSGNQGPVATSWAAFQQYQRNEAWLWEHLALTRARCLLGPDDLVADIHALLSEIYNQRRDRKQVLQDVRTMRHRLAEAKQSVGPFDPKSGPGRLLDMELFVQTGALLSGQAAHDIAGATKYLRDCGLADTEGTAILAKVYRQTWALQIAMRLVTRDPSGADTLGQGAKTMILRAIGAEDMAKAAEQLDLAFARTADLVRNGLETEATDG